MRYCANCRAPLYSAFCPVCGAAADAPIPEKPTYGVGIPGAALSEYQAAALCYLGGFLTGAIFLYMEPYSRNRVVRFHAQQSILLTAAWMVILLTVGVVAPLAWRPRAFVVMQFAGLALWVAMMALTWRRIHVELPVLKTLARKNM